MIIHEMPQLSDEWFAVKCGKISASNMSAVLAKGRGNSESKTRKSYMCRLIAERLSGMPQETYTNGSMQWGIETEPQAREAYEMAKLDTVKQVGFIEVNEYLGCSPDGLVGEDGLLEVKCPNTSTHIQYILDGKMPAEYVLQVQTQLWVCERQWCDFVSFDPRVTVRPFWCIRVERDEKKIQDISDGVDAFVEEMETLIAKIKEK